jgi:uncharacterized membrane protein
VVLVEYPRKGLWTMGFVTGKVSPQLQTHLQQEVTSVFIPTTPNPTSGWYTVVPQQEVIDIDISIEDAFKVLISGGIVSPEMPGVKSTISAVKPPEQTLIDKALVAEQPGLISVEDES